MISSRRPDFMRWFQLAFLLLGASWLFAPALNHVLTYRTTLISQYEAPGQPFSLWFRLSDIMAALLVIGLSRVIRQRPGQRLTAATLLIIGFGMLVDPVFPTHCQMVLNSCQEQASFWFVFHAAATIITSTAIFLASIYHVWRKRRLISLGFVLLQVGYFILFLTQWVSHASFNTIFQYGYETLVIVWLAWFMADTAMRLPESTSPQQSQFVKRLVAAWAFGNGLLAILISLADLDLLGRLHGLYFAGDTAWLAQHGVVVGVIMLYLSRHLARGERRACQIFLLITGLDTLKYAIIAPHPLLMLSYLLTFVGLFIFRDVFDRGLLPVTIRIRVKDALYMLGSLLLAMLIGLIVLQRTDRLSVVTAHSIDHFFDYTLRAKVVPRMHRRSALLAHTESAFALAGLTAILWSLFRPNRPRGAVLPDVERAEHLLGQYSTSSEDYFKLWPADKQYFWNQNQSGFIAYKLVGPIAFALPGPIATQGAQADLLSNFISWCRARRLRACFLPIYQQRRLYRQAGLNSLQIGATAMITTKDFLDHTAQDKWWRWQKNRASKAGYLYDTSQAPHPAVLLAACKKVSNAWLHNGHQERGFALGYFDAMYLDRCQLHYLTDIHGQVVAFANQLPTFNDQTVATVDLMRALPEADNAMPFLLAKIIEQLHDHAGIQQFDLGFVPFAANQEPIIKLAQSLSAGRFSSSGLEQFKNKFNPHWQLTYLAYDGDLGDLALIATHLEKALSRIVSRKK